MNASATTRGDRQVLRMERRFSHSIDKVWRAISDPAELSVWWPLKIDELPLEQGAPLRFYEGDIVANGWITEVEIGRVLGFVDEQGEHEVRLELTPLDGGCLLVFTHIFPAGQPPAQHEAGWNQCFDVLEGRLQADVAGASSGGASSADSGASRSAYEPGPAGDARAEQNGDRWTLVMVRQLKHPPAKVWHALTDPSQLSEWAPFDPDRSLAATGVVAFSMAGGSEPSDPMECIVTRAEPPNVLEYHWGGDVVRWELRPIENGTRLTLHHTVQDRTWAPKVAAGWHICLDVMERAIDGRAIGRIVAAEAKAFGWERLNADYAEKFGVENTGWPEQVPAG